MGSVLHGCDDGAVDLTFAASLDNRDSSQQANALSIGNDAYLSARSRQIAPETFHGGLGLLDVILHEARIVWINKEGNPSGAGKDLTQ